MTKMEFNAERGDCNKRSVDEKGTVGECGGSMITS